MSGFVDNIDWSEIGQATLDTLSMLGGSMALTVVLGLPLGVILFLTGKGQMLQNRVANGVLSLVINILRSVPFVILLIVMIPLTVALVGTSLGVAGAIPPLVAGAAPFFARLVETALREVDKGVIEASFAMGAKRRQVVLGALLPEAMPGLIAAATVTAIALVSYTAMAGVVGAGGLGDLAIRFGYQRFNPEMMVIVVVVLIVLVQVVQSAGDGLARRFDKRNRKN